MSSLSSIQSSPMFVQSSVEFNLSQNKFSSDVKEELQKAFEEGNKEAILDLLRRGANPNQPLQCTQKIARLRTRDYVAQTLLPEDWYEEGVKFVKSEDYADSLDSIQDIEMKDQIEDIIARLQNEEVITDDEMIDFSNALYVAIIFQMHGEKIFQHLYIHPLVVAFALHDFDLARALIEAGADIQDPLFLESLELFFKNAQHENILNFLTQQGLNEEDIHHFRERHQQFEWRMEILNAGYEGFLRDDFDEEMEALPLPPSQKV